MLESLGINGEALEDVVFEAVGGPGAELGGPGALNAVADGDDGFQAVEPCAILFPVGGSYRGFLGNCGFIEFPVGKDVLEVKRDVVGGALIQVSHELLGEPDILVIEADFHTGPAIFRLEDGDVIRPWRL